MSTPEFRHLPADRLFHWVMAILVLLLLGTGFLPIIGIKFDWLPIHWVSGVLLIIAVLFHLWRALVAHGIREMTPGLRDFTPQGLIDHDGPDKYSAGQKHYHLAVSTILLALLITGGLMLAKIDTDFWKRAPTILSDQNWGIVYVIHGAAASLLIFFLILHVYFAFLPEHRKLLAAMALGRPVNKTGKKTD